MQVSDIGAGSPAARPGSVPGSLRSSVGDALRRAETLLWRGGQQRARRNAWDAVCENRRQARDRQEAEHLLGMSAGSTVPRSGPSALQ